MNSKIKSEATDTLFEAVLKLESLEQCYDFFEDLCTIAEIKAMSQRLKVAQMLHDGCCYQDIVIETGASTATISRVNNALQYGNDGYKSVLK